MSSSRSRFLLDENVRRELYLFLKNRHTNVKTCPKGLRNGAIAKLCLSEAGRWSLTMKIFRGCPLKKFTASFGSRFPRTTRMI